MESRSVGPYLILQKLGAGGMGEVYLAEDPRLRRRIALKTLSGPRAQAPDARRRLIHEARAAAALNHPNIAAIYDVVEDEDGAHIVMEYVPGQSLAERLRDGPLPVVAVMEIALQLADALVEAHSRGVIHRDLKPANVVVTPDGRVKVLDFGLAKSQVLPSSSSDSSSEDPSSSSGHFSAEGRVVVGTPPYVSPEHLLGHPVDERSDIYSFGVLLYELLTGRRPFEGPNVAALAESILRKQPVPLRQANAAVPVALERLVLRAMSRNPAHRPASARSLRIDVSRLAHALTEATTASVRARANPQAPRAAGLSAWTGVAVVASAIAIAVSAGASRFSSDSAGAETTSASRRDAPVVAVLPLTSLSAEGDSDYLAAGIADALINALARVPGVNVVSRSATLSYGERSRDVTRLAREVGATLVVEGAVQRVQDRVRVTLSLIEATDNLVAWSGAFDGGLGDVFALQGQLGDAVSAAMRIRLSPVERERVRRSPTDNVEAFAEYSQARNFLERPDVPANVERAIGLFRSAVAKDPKFAIAHAGLGQAYWVRYQQTKDPDWTIAARDATAEALRLAPHEPSVHHSLALIYRGTGRALLAKEELRRAIALQPAGDDAHRLLGRILVEEGATVEGIAELQTAISLRPNFWGNHDALGLAYYDSGGYQDARAAYRRVTELQPDNPWGFQMLGTVEHALGERASAAQNYEHAISLGPDEMAYSNLGTLHYEDGRFEQAARAFEEAARLDPKSPSKQRNLGDTYDRLGRHGRALDCYRRAAALSGELLRTNPEDARALAMMAVYEAKLGRHAQAQTHATAAAALEPRNADVAYRQAVVYALAGNTTAAVIRLGAALELGYSGSFAQRDDDLRALRDMPGYKVLFVPEARERKSP